MKLYSTIFLVFLSMLFSTNILAEQSAQSCYENKDWACLENLTKTENPEAFYYFGLYKWRQVNDVKGAKKLFEMAMFFGKGYPEAKTNLQTFYKENLIAFSATDCDIAGLLDCLVTFADDKNDKGAQYLLAKRLIKTEPERAVEYFIKSANQGHDTSPCILARIYRNGLSHIKPDYNQEVEWKSECSGKKPYKKFNEKHFAKYEKMKGHKAYAYSDSGKAIYSDDFTSKDVAARLALDFCVKHNKKQEAKYPCRVINIDGEWVRDVEPKPIDNELKGVDALTKGKAKANYQGRYSKMKGQKVFAYANTGVFFWQSSTKKSVDELSKKVLRECRSSNKKWEAQYPCKIVDINGEWVN